MNPETPRPPRKELELRLTALLLGELPAEEAAALRELIAKDAPLAELHERLKRAIDLVREAAATHTEPDAAHAQEATLKLSDERRQRLLAHFKTVAPKEFVPRPRRREWSWLVPLSAAAAAIALLAAIAVPGISRRESAQAYAVLNNLRILEGAKDQWALEHKNSSTDVLTLDDLKDYLKGGGVHSVQGEQYNVGRVADPVTAEVDAAQAKKTFGALATKRSPQPAGGQRARLNADGELRFVDKNGMPSAAAAQSGGVSSAPVVRYSSTAPQEEKLVAAKPLGPSEAQPAPVKAFKNGIVAPPMPTQESTRKVESLEARHGGATLRQEIVLPPSDAQDDWAMAKIEAPLNQAVRGFPLGDLLAQSTTGGRGGVFGSGGGGGIGGGAGAGFGPVADAQPDSNTRNAWLFGNPGSIGILERPAPSSGGSTNPFVARYQFALDTPPAGGDFTTFGSHPRQPAGPNQPPVNGEAKFAESNRADNKALDFAWNARELERERRMGIRGDAAPPVAAQPSKAKPAIRDADADTPRSADKLDGALSLSTINGRALQEKRVAAGAAGATATPVPGTASPARPVDRLDRSGLVAPKPDGIDDRYAYQVPRLGDAPELGRYYYKIKPELSEAEGKPGSKVESLPQITGKDLTRLNEVANGVSQNAERKGRADQNVASVEEPAQAIPLGVEAISKSFSNDGKLITRNAATTEEGVRQKLSTVVLPPVAPDTTAGVPIVVTGSLMLERDAAKTKLSASELSAPAPALETETLRRVEAAGESATKQKADLAEAKREQDTKIAQVKERLERLQDEPNSEQAEANPPRVTIPAPIPQPEVQAGDNAYSTFSLNVSDVSFKLAAASLEKGVMPEPATVRSEGFINAFDYRDPEPPPGVPIAFVWERTRYPFAHNRDLLRFSVKTASAGRQPGRPLNLVLLLDNSGSMERADRVQIIYEALRVLATQLQPQDKFSVVTFARTARLWVDGVAGNEAVAVADQISSLTPQGGTNLGDAMDLAYMTAVRHYLANGVNRIVLLTDGAANLGNVDPNALKQKVEAHRKQGIALDCFGIGWEGYNDDLLEILSRNGDGRYGFINTPEEAASDFAGQLAGALRVAASDVKVQVEFNPGRVTAYRQIGYAKHQLTKEQFRDDTVDAAEIGAAESGNALYVAEVNARGEGPLAIVRVRYKVPGTADYREHQWAVPYTGNAVSLEQASPAMRLAATASAFSEWLVSSPYAAEITPDRLLGYLGGVPETYGADARPKKLEWMIRQAKSISGK